MLGSTAPKPADQGAPAVAVATRTHPRGLSLDRHIDEKGTTPALLRDPGLARAARPPHVLQPARRRPFQLPGMWRAVAAALLLAAASAAAQSEPKLSDERVVFQTDFGDIEFGFYAEVGAPS
jgi:hypothetical protein